MYKISRILLKNFKNVNFFEKLLEKLFPRRFQFIGFVFVVIKVANSIG